MRNFKRLSFILISAYFIISCDPPHDVLFINSSNSDLSIKILKNENKYIRLNHAIENDSMRYFLKSKDTIRLQFGIGVWSENEIDNVTSGIKKIEFETKNVKTTYKNKDVIFRLFNSNKKGWINKREIIIYINE